MFRFCCCVIVLSGLSLLGIRLLAADEPAFRIESSPGKLQVSWGQQPLATYVFDDRVVGRPYFQDVRTLDGTPTTRNHPPREGTDATDHATMHPGIWLAFGDLSGADFWRNKARVEHDGFVEAPRVDGPRASFSVRNRYRSGDEILCTEVCRHQLLRHPTGWMLTYESTFTSERPFAFGDQEEMGLGVRVATPLRVKDGKGEILNSRDQRNEKNVWGQTADWCDYCGEVNGQRVGLLLMPDPANFRPCWFHARDYGFVAANPFGRKAFTRGELSRVEIKPGESFRLRFGVLVHGTPADQPFDAQTTYQDFVNHLRTEPVSKK